jgi:hypothetical protein
MPSGVTAAEVGLIHAYRSVTHAPERATSSAGVPRSLTFRCAEPNCVLRPSSQMMKGYDEDYGFALFEIAGDELYFQIVSRRARPSTQA